MNARIAAAYRTRHGLDLPRSARLAIAGVLLILSGFLAARFGLVVRIAAGCRVLA